MTKFPYWDSVLMDMVERPSEVVVVSVKRRAKRHRGWANNNYLSHLSNASALKEQPEENPYLEEVSTVILFHDPGSDDFCQQHF